MERESDKDRYRERGREKIKEREKEADLEKERLKEKDRVSKRSREEDHDRTKDDIAEMRYERFKDIRIERTDEFGHVNPGEASDPRIFRAFGIDEDRIVYRRSYSDRMIGWPWPSLDHIQWVKDAETALNCYNKEQDARFELVGLGPRARKNLVIIPSIDESLGHWVHICFIAKPRKSTDDHVQRKLFFAELVYYCSSSKARVTHCSILEPNDPGITYGCGICDPSEKIPHSSRYLVGHWPYQNGEIPDSVYESHWFQEEMPGSSKGRQLDLNKLFKGDVPTDYLRCNMKSPDFAELALELHKKGQGAEFELVEALGFSRRVFVSKRVEDWVHVSFTAKPRNGYCTGCDDDVSPKLFFAQLFAYGQQKHYTLVQCSILEPNHPGITYECRSRICDPKKKIAHPSECLISNPEKKTAHPLAGKRSKNFLWLREKMMEAYASPLAAVTGTRGGWKTAESLPPEGVNGAGMGV